MNFKSLTIGALALTLVFSSCNNMNNTTKGGLIGAGSGAVLGAVVGKIAGNTAIGAVVGTAVGTGAGVLIGRKMDKAKAAAQAAVQNAQVETMTDTNGLDCVKITFDSGILFATGKYALSANAKDDLNKFAKVLRDNTDMDVAIYGHTDITGSDKVNNPLSLNRAKAVQEQLTNAGVLASQFKVVEGKGSKEPVASNDTNEGRAQNRRVEVYLYASPEMIKAAEAGTLQ